MCCATSSWNWLSVGAGSLPEKPPIAMTAVPVDNSRPAALDDRLIAADHSVFVSFSIASRRDCPRSGRTSKSALPGRVGGPDGRSAALMRLADRDDRIRGGSRPARRPVPLPTHRARRPAARSRRPRPEHSDHRNERQRQDGPPQAGQPGCVPAEDPPTPDAGAADQHGQTASVQPLFAVLPQLVHTDGEHRGHRRRNGQAVVRVDHAVHEAQHQSVHDQPAAEQNRRGPRQVCPRCTSAGQHDQNGCQQRGGHQPADLEAELPTEQPRPALRLVTESAEPARAARDATARPPPIRPPGLGGPNPMWLRPRTRANPL